MQAFSRLGGSGVVVESYDLDEPRTFYDAALNEVRPGDFIVRLNTTPGTVWLETREVLAVTPQALLLASSHKGGRTTSTSNNTNVMRK